MCIDFTTSYFSTFLFPCMCAAIRKFCQQVTNPASACNEDDSGEESDDGSSTTPSSHGEAESVDEPKKPKRTRTAFSNLQLDQLELAFSRSHYPDVFTREDLSNKLSIKEDRIQVQETADLHFVVCLIL